MAKLMRYLIPQKLKYRLFMAFVCVVLLPFCALNLYNYQRIETLVQQKISQQSHYQAGADVPDPGGSDQHRVQNAHFSKAGRHGQIGASVPRAAR